MSTVAPPDTIVAVATPYGRGGLGIVRLSGPQALPIAQALLADGLGAPAPAEWVARRVRPMRFLDPAAPRDGAVPLDEVLVTYFRAPHSYTAEDVIEIAGHGSPPLLAAMLAAAQARGARLAEPGEFTRRAFLNGRLDLTQAEAVRDLINAQTLFQARTAARQLQGSVAHRLQPLQTALIELIARLEAGIDFADDDVALPSDALIAGACAGLLRQAESALAGFRCGRLIRDGLALAILGRPNVGKSSLFNRLVGSDRAIVTAAPGTTRDLVAESIDFEGIPLRCVDTAGVREAQAEAEQLGIARTWQAVADADLVVAVFDASAPLRPEDERLLARLAPLPRLLPVLNKCDLPARLAPEQLHAALSAAGRQPPGEAVCRVSALTGQGLGEFREALRRCALPDLTENGDFLTNARHAEHLQAFAAAVERARGGVAAGVPHEALLIDLHQALQELGAITGQTTIEDILGVIFSTFCVGK